MAEADTTSEQTEPSSKYWTIMKFQCILVWESYQKKRLEVIYNFTLGVHIFSDEGSNRKRLQSSESNTSKELRSLYQAIDREKLVNRRQKADMSAGYISLKDERRDSMVRGFIDKLKSKHESSVTLKDNENEVENENKE